MINSFPWDSKVIEMGEDGFPVYDRAYAADDLAEVYETFFSYGIFIDSDEGMAVTSNNNMTLTIGFGKCHIRGRIGYIKKEREIVSIEAPSSQPRIDTVVLRFNRSLSAREITVEVKKGTPSTTPTRPSLTRNSSVYELGLADILINTNTSTITNQIITDTRLETSRCGIVVPFMEIDVTSFYHRMDAAIEAGIRKHQAMADAEMEKLDIAVNNAIELADKITSGTGEGCGCYEEMQQIKNLLYELLGREDDTKYYVIGKTLYAPPDKAEYVDDKIAFKKSATVSGNKLELA